MNNLAAIRARAAAATSQPWTRFKQEIYDAQHRLLCYVNERHTSLDDEETRREDRSNAIFITHSREDVPMLLAYVDAQATRIVGLEQERQRMLDWLETQQAEVDKRESQAENDQQRAYLQGKLVAFYNVRRTIEGETI